MATKTHIHGEKNWERENKDIKRESKVGKGQWKRKRERHSLVELKGGTVMRRNK